MDLYEFREERLDVIAEEAEVAGREGSATRGVSTFQRFSVNTNESLHFEPCEDSPPSPTGAEDGYDDDSVFKEGETQVKTVTQLLALSA